MHWIICTCTGLYALALCVNAVDFFKRYPFGTYAPPYPTQYSVGPFYRLLPLQLLVGRKPKKFTMEFSKTNEYTKFLQNTCLLLRFI